MKWHCHGVIWCPDGSRPWAHSHATCPTPLLRRSGGWRVFLQSRDAHGVGRVTWIDLDGADPRRIVGMATQPVLDIGAPGCFDENGVFPTSVLRAADGRVWLYYVGFELGHRIRYRLLTGLAVSDDDGDSFCRVSTMPVLERTEAEPFFRCGTFVRCDGGRFRMWYVAGNRWETVRGKAVPLYDLRYSESADGVHWPAQGDVVLALQPGEHGFGRPWVRTTADGEEMFFSVRRREAEGHRLGYARSTDGRRWQRQDAQLGLPRATGAWDTGSQCYAAPIRAAGREWLLYNGNDFGATGVGIAERVTP